jgi:hypothetical protein
MSRTRTARTRTGPVEPLIACLAGPLRGQWFWRRDWDALLRAGERMLARGQRPAPVLSYVLQVPGEPVLHPDLKILAAHVADWQPAWAAQAARAAQITAMPMDPLMRQRERELTRLTVIPGAAAENDSGSIGSRYTTTTFDLTEGLSA